MILGLSDFRPNTIYKKRIVKLLDKPEPIERQYYYLSKTLRGVMFILIRMDHSKKKKRLLEKKEKTKKYIKDELEKLKVLKSRYGRKMTIARLKTMKGFEKISDEVAKQVIEQLEEYASIVIKQLNRLQPIKIRSYE